MLLGDMIREYKIAEEAFMEKKEEIVKELNTIFGMLPFDVTDPEMGSEDENYHINYFYIDEQGQVRISWGF